MCVCVCAHAENSRELQVVCACVVGVGLRKLVAVGKVGWEMETRAVALLRALLVFSLAAAVSGKIN